MWIHHKGQPVTGKQGVLSFWVPKDAYVTKPLHSRQDTMRLATSHFDVGKRMVGNSMIIVIIGIPIIIGVIKEANKFSFIFLLKER